MSHRRTEIQGQSRHGDRFQVTAQETDSPILPVPQLKSLHEFRPDLVDWVVKRTESEGDERRARQRRVDRYIFIERVGGLVGGIAIAAVGLGVAAYLALSGQPEVAKVVGGGTLVSIVTVIVGGRYAAAKAATNATPQSDQKKKR